MALSEQLGKVLLLTYTINNQIELVRHICRLNKFQPRNLVVKGWFSFLLEDMIRPYQRCAVRERFTGVFLNPRNPHLVEGKTFHIKGRAEKIDGQYNPLHFVTDENAHQFLRGRVEADLPRAQKFQLGSRAPIS